MSRPRTPPRGFTLIELIVAIALMALMFSAAAMGVGALTGSRARQAAGELSGTIRSLYDTANLTGKTCRLVFKLPDVKDEGNTSYWAECAAGNITTARDRDATLKGDTRAAEEEQKRNRGKKKTADTGTDLGGSTYQDVVTAEKRRVESAVKFSAFTNEEVKPQQLKGVTVKVWTRHQREPVTNGLAYLYFFPQGFTERAQVYFHQGHNDYTILVSPLTGRTSVVGEYVEVPRT